MDYRLQSQRGPEGLIECTPQQQAPHTMNWSEFFAMGGYATYVWTSYGLMAVILILNVVLPLRKKAAALDKARRFIARGKKA